jgi:hypothetical protein
VPRPTRRPLAWVLTLLWASAIFYVSSRTGNSLPGGFSVQGHVFEYFVLGGLLAWALAEEEVSPSAIVLAVLLASLYGVTDEFHQHFVPGRTPDLMDWLLDTAGAIAGAFVARWLVARSNRKRSGQEQRSVG